MNVWNKIKQIALYLWQMPLNLIGAILFYLYYRDGEIILLDKDSSIKVNCGSKKMHGGITLGNYIIISKPSILNHELGHTIQSKMLGPLYLLVIGLRSIIHAALHKDICKNKDYYHFWTEKWANKLVDKYYKKVKED